MKILIVSSGDFHSSYGGGQVYVKNLTDELIGQGADVVIASRHEDAEGAVPYRNTAIHFYRNSGQTLQSGDLAPLLQQIRPDVVHAHGDKAVFARACAAQGVPCIVTIHHGGLICPAGTLLDYRDRICRVRAVYQSCLPCVLKNIRGGIFSWYPLRFLPYKIMIRTGDYFDKKPFIPYLTPVALSALIIRETIKEWGALCRDASLLVAPSRAIAESAVCNGAARKKVKVLAHGIRTPYAPGQSARSAFAGDGDDERVIRFFYVGRICRVKGLHILLEAFSRVTGPVELHLIGAAGNKAEYRYQEDLKVRSRRDKQVVWHGKIEPDRVQEAICHYDVMVHPALYLEVFGLTIAESLVMGKPVIATRCGGAEAQIEHGQNGLLVEPGDVHGLRTAMQEVVSNADLLQRLEMDPGRQVKTLSNHARELVELYQDVVMNNASVKTLPAGSPAQGPRC